MNVLSREPTATTSLQQFLYVDPVVEGFNQNCPSQASKQKHWDHVQHGPKERSRNTGITYNTARKNEAETLGSRTTNPEERTRNTGTTYNTV